MEHAPEFLLPISKVEKSLGIRTIIYYILA